MAAPPDTPAPSCPFCAIVAGRTAAHVLLDQPEAIAFLDARPVFPGHALVVPRSHVETLVDLPAGDVGPFFRSVQRVTRAVEAGLAADGTFVAMNNKISQSVPHLHVHVVPRKKKDGLRGFFWPRVKYASAEDAAKTAAAIRAAMLLACLVLVSACSAPSKGSLVLAIGTDMQTPKDIDVVSVFVSEGTAVKFDYLGHVLPEGTVALPATLALVEPDDPTTPIQIRIVGFHQKTARVLRDIQTSVPHQRTSLLRVPLDFIDDRSGIGTIPDKYFPSATDGVAEGLSSFDPTVIASKCDPMRQCQVPGASCMTTVDGACASAVVDADMLPAYVPQAVFGGDGGVLASGAPESCFDVETCFANAAPMTSITSTACFFPFPSGASLDTLNVGLVTPGTGACVGAGACYVALPEDPNEGWTLQGSTVKLAPGVCSQLGSGVTVVVAAGTCPTETLSQPICEPTGADAATSAPEVESSADGAFDDAG